MGAWRRPAQDLGVTPGANLVSRRLVLTSTHLVERRAQCYSLAACHALTSISALVRFVEVR